MSRFIRCNCPAGFGAGAEHHAPDCPGRRLDRSALDTQLAAAMNRPAPVDTSLMAPTAPMPVVIKRSFVAPSDFGASNPVVNVTGYSAQRAAFQELLQKTRHEQEEMQDTLLLSALGMTREEAVASCHRITRHCHPDRDLFLLDGEPVIEIHKPVIRGDQMVTSYKILRTMP